MLNMQLDVFAGFWGNDGLTAQIGLKPLVAVLTVLVHQPAQRMPGKERPDWEADATAQE